MGRVDRTTDTQAVPYERAVGSMAHQLVGSVARARNGVARDALVDLIWREAGTLAVAAGLGPRTRAARLVTAGAAAVYLRYFMPPASWRLMGVEEEIPEGRVDLAWAGDLGFIYDELKLAGGQRDFNGDGPTSRQVRRYLSHGSATHGDQFVGVRLILLGAPRKSMLIGPGDRVRRLVDTPVWFESSREVQVC